MRKQFSQMKNHPQSPSTSQNRMPSHVDSDGDPPLINVTHHMQTEEETAYDDDFDIDYLPFIRHSQPSATSCQMPEIMHKNVYEQSSLESVKVPNTQCEKYNLPTDTTSSSSHNNESSSIPKDQNSSRQLHQNFIQYFPQTVLGDTHLHGNCEQHKEYNKEASWLHAELFFVLVSMWLPQQHMVSIWTPHGIHVETLWCPVEIT